MLVRALCMSNERKCENACFRSRRQLQTPQTAQKRTSMPICAHVAPSIVNVQSQCTGKPLDLVSAAGKTLGLTTGMNLSDFPTKFRTKPGMSAALTSTVCTRFSCGLLASVDQLTLLACGAKKAPMSISVSLSEQGTASRPVSVAATGQLGFGCSCGLCRFFLTLVSCPLLLLSRPLLLPRPRPLPLPVRFLLVKEVVFW